MALTGGFWYLRNLVAVGNPIPYIHHLGPDLAARPGARLLAAPRLRRLALLHRHRTSGRDWFFPGLHDSLGLFWPATVIGVAAVAIYALVRGREPILRLLGALAG